MRRYDPRRMMVLTGGMWLAGAVLAVGFALCAPAQAEAKACQAPLYAELRKPADPKARPLEIACDMTLGPKDVISRPIAFSGARASGVTLDCKGGTLGTADAVIGAGRPTVVIRSLKGGDGQWSVPEGVTVRNCKIIGNLRLMGLGPNGQGELVKLSSRRRDHTARAQAAAPRDILLDNLDFVARGTVPLYLGPGVTRVTVNGSRFRGEAKGTAVYLDAESAENRFTGNLFAMKTTRREQIAIDGSARNVISGNVFENPVNGGIFLYRNAGEGGTIRHQPPQYNVIEGNTFRYEPAGRPRPAIWLNQRNGKTSHRFSDPAFPFGSSLDPRDFAQFNIVRDNRFIGGGRGLIRNADPTNEIVGND
ncbi:right-handed parallel beta-helix repeat-containing protein [Ciceribacter selenitireducens]|uniref:right-handed parallel beta-helix repeat-containing protein n=1 Tax=Ciceribacter selenitireducens TaxID=448181 RepID=UPI0004B7EC34|nr:right-handed parallel beta-helix repeat-containing protein [Ciceribacter selenitireducens]